MSKQKDGMTSKRWKRIKALRDPLRVNPQGKSILRFLPHLARFYPFRSLVGIV